jgi:hypothetical protein
MAACGFSSMIQRPEFGTDIIRLVASRAWGVLMESQPCWGTQIGGIQDLSTGIRSIGAVDGAPERLSADHQDRIEDFMKRHGGPAPAASRQGCIEAGYRGWSEIYAADGYVLRTEWSRSELRGTMNVSELAPSF